VLGVAVVFEHRVPPQPPPGGEAPAQVTVRLGNNDLLPFNNVRHATFLVREPRKILTLADDPADAERWARALEVTGAFRCEVRKPPADAAALPPDYWKAYKVVCLFQVARPSDDLLRRLEDFVRSGGGLVLVPGGEEVQLDAYNQDAAARGLLPAAFERLVTVPDKERGKLWSPFRDDNAVTAYFARSVRTEDPDFGRPDRWPFAYRYWKLAPAKEAKDLATFEDAEDGGPKSPALVEKPLGRGTVIQFATALGNKAEARKNVPWHNYWTESSFGLILANEVCRALAGESTAPELNFLCGQPVQLALPARPPPPPYRLEGPDLAGAEGNLAPDEAGRLTVTQALAPGNYLVRQGKDSVVAGFSLAVRADESNLERVPAEEIEAVLGKGSVLEVGRTVSLRDALQGHWAPPVELLPWLMLLVLLGLTVESLLANKFYRRRDVTPAPEPQRAAP
jgi:hypothetical protein